MFLTILTFLIILLVLVLVHEFGHFLFAKLARVKVEEFAFGFPPRLATIKKGETNYSFNLLPLGGYVKIQGEEGEDANDPRSFSAQRFWTKILIIAAGVGFNFILAYILFTSSLMIGAPAHLADDDPYAGAQVLVVDVQQNSPAEAAGLKPGDQLLKITQPDGKVLDVTRVDEVQNFIQQNKGRKISIEYDRAGEKKSAEATVRSETKPGEGALGVSMDRQGIKSYGFGKSIIEGFKSTVTFTRLTAEALFSFFKRLILGGASFNEVSGPIGIVLFVQDNLREGISFLINITALLSINLAIINILPFPGLDGGRILFIVLEKIKGSPFHWKTTRAVHAAGFAILILLMILVTYHDIVKINS